MAGPGRPPSQRQIYPCDAQTYRGPERIAFDTSFIVEFLMAGQPHIQAAADGFVKMVRDGSEIVLSSLVDLELVEACYQVALRERYGKRWAQARPDGRARRRAARLTRQARDAWHRLLTVLPTTVIDVGMVSDDVPELMRRYGLGSYDAAHVATALHAGVDAAATLDTGFAQVPASRLEIHTVSAKVSRMRQIRARRAQGRLA